MFTPRRFITVTVIVVVAILTALVGSQAALTDQRSTSKPASLEGSWTVSITEGAGTPDLPSWYTAQVTFTPGGGMVATISDPNILPGHGAWTRLGKRKFAITIFFFQFNPAGDFLGTLRARATLEVNKKSRIFNSDDYRFDFFDPNGNPTGLAGVGKGSGRSHRGGALSAPRP